MPVIRFNGKKLDPATIKALVAGTLVNGSKPSVWWGRQSADFRNTFMDTMRTSMRNGETLTQAITRVTGGTIDGATVPGILKTTKNKAGALTATAQNAVSNQAALETFQANNDVIKAVTQVSTLDNRTSDICIAYSGQTWDVNTLKPITALGSTLPFNGGPPRHFNCRSRLRPVTKSFRELGIDADEIPAGTRASMDGQVPADITFNQFLKGKTKSFQNKLLGSKRAQLWRNGDINLTQLVDMRGNPMSLAQLEQKLGILPKPAPPPIPVAPKPNMVPSFLDDVFITEAEHAEIKAHAAKLVKNASAADDLVTSQIKTMADDVGAAFPDAAVVKDGPLVKEGSLHWRMKDADSTSRKIQTYARDRQLTYTEAAEQISDSLRYTYIVDEADYVRAVQETMERFAELGYKNGKFDAAWFKRPDYRGLNINMITPEGVKMELQFHTAKSFEIKNGINHELYEKFRKLSTAKQKGKEGQLLQAQMKANADTIPFPPSIKELDELAKIYNKPNSLEQSWIFDEAETRMAIRTVEEAAKKFPKGLVEFEDFMDLTIVGVESQNATLAGKLREAAFKVIAEPARQDAALLLRIESRIEMGVKPDALRTIIKNSKATPEAKKAANDIVSKTAKAAQAEASQAMGQIADIEFSSMAEYAAWVKAIRPGLTKAVDNEFMKLVEIGENKVKSNIALKEAAKQIELGDLGLAKQVLTDLDSEAVTLEVTQQLKLIAKKGVESAKKVKKGLDDLMEVLQPTSVQHIEDAVKAASNLAKPTAKMQMENYGLTLTELFEKKVAKKISDFTFKVTDDLKKAGYSPQEIALLDMKYMDEIAVLKNGIFDDAVRANTRKVIEDAKTLIEDAVDKVKAINKASGGVDKMSAVLSDLPLKIRESDMLQKAIKKPYQQALKKATDAKILVKKAFIEQTKFTADDYTAFSHIIDDALKDVHKKLGPKQLKAKVVEIEAKLAQAKKGNVSITNFVEDATNYDEIVDSVLGTHTKQQLDEAVKLFKLDGNSATARSKLFDTLGNASTERQKIAIKEYVHARVNPKKLPNGMNFNEAVARVVTEHANNTNSIDIMDLMKSLLQGADDSLKTNFEQTIFTRAKVKSIDALGVTPEGQATPAVLRIREQLLKKGDLQDVPIPKVTPAEEFAAVKEWLHSGTLPDADFKRQQLRTSKSLVASAEGKIREGDRIFGENSWGITPKQWQKWVDDVAPTLTDWDVSLINQYTGGMAGTINRGLRTVSELPKFNGGARALNSALDKMPKHKGTVYRGTQPRDDWSVDFIDAKYEVGKVVSERGFGSSSTQSSAQFNGPLKFIIKTNGSQGAIIGHVGQYGTQEMEVLFKAGSRFRVVRKKRQGRNGITVWMEEI